MVIRDYIYQCSVPTINSYNSISEILKNLKENKIYSFVSVLKSMGRNNKDYLWTTRLYISL